MSRTETSRHEPPHRFDVPRCSSLAAWAKPYQSPIVATCMLVAVLAVYLPPMLKGGSLSLLGLDYLQLHSHRLTYVQEALHKGQGLPGWYTRELLGTPFWSNLQSFPWIPTRLFLLFWAPDHAFFVAVVMASLLAALFTFLYARRIGFTAFPAACAGWTFACTGFFASRILAGHLPVIEAYPALPFLLWLVERGLDSGHRSLPVPSRLAALAIGTACVALAGHPQIPAYAIGATILYILWWDRSRRGLMLLSAMGAGCLCTLFAWWPMLELILRSTRVLGLETPANDLALPTARLWGYIMPWKDGWPRLVNRLPWVPFNGYPHEGYFWDTVIYVGLAPLLALVFLAAIAVFRRKKISRTGLFFILIGLLSLLTALPFAQGFFHLLPGTFLRSPSRQLYLTGFSLSLGLGYAVKEIWTSKRARNSRWLKVGALAIIACHGLDLGSHDRCFIKVMPKGNGIAIPGLERLLREGVGDGRVAMDFNLPMRCNRQYDDVGFFDAILLAQPYELLIRLAGLPARTNVETLNGSQLSSVALARLCVRYVVTSQPRPDLPLVARMPLGAVYSVPNPSPRVTFVPDTSSNGPPDVSLRYSRPSSDEIHIKLEGVKSGLIKVVESWDPGWSATVDGVPCAVGRVDGCLMAVRVTPGKHTVWLKFRTPGLRLGVVLSLGALTLLFALAWIGGRTQEFLRERD